MGSAPQPEKHSKSDAAYKPDRSQFREMDLYYDSKKGRILSSHVRDSRARGNQPQHTATSTSPDISNHRLSLRHPPLTKYHHTSEAPGSLELHSPIPTKVQEVLAQSGIFDNIGISTAIRHKTGTATVGRLTGRLDWEDLDVRKYNASKVEVPRDRPIQIVRYQDRGTMVKEISSFPQSPPETAQKAAPLSSNNHFESTGRIKDAKHAVVEQTCCSDAAVIDVVSFVEETADRRAQPDTAKESVVQVNSVFIPEQPTPPKAAMILKIEAAAEQLEGSNSFQSEHMKQGTKSIRVGQPSSPVFKYFNVQRSARAYQAGLHRGLTDFESAMLVGGPKPEHYHHLVTTMIESPFRRVISGTSSSTYELQPELQHQHIIAADMHGVEVGRARHISLIHRR
ncbi:hypothetical protein BD289DRAFT_90436 [Coniella lustricola]|uniref:Uncharacterized protein n=1 Tax=Coniella lustricola TaxID=2025994 RepID=A0A2T3AGY4_9PEZI|nr:hypothetical protein BD289DRAFT_90436 [Coniella lustricola]